MRYQPITRLDHFAGDLGVTAFVRLVQTAAAQENKKRAKRQQKESPTLSCLIPDERN
jgi:hypothetical protein